MAQAVRRTGDAPEFLERLNFDSYFYDDIIERCFGVDIRRKARALIRDPEYQQKLQRGFMSGDDASDQLAAKLKQDHKAREDYDIAVARGLAAVDNPCPELVAFMDHAVNIPDLFDREMIELGGHVFLTKFNPVTFFAYGVPCILLQGPSVGIMAAGNFTNQPRERTTIVESVKLRQTTDRLAVRFAETFKWFTAVAQPGAGQPYTSAFQQSCRIRLIHSHIRLALNRQLNQASWNFDPPIGWMVDELGTPLSAADGSIVVTTVAIAIMMAERHLGQRVTEKELEALFQFASYLNYMQGVPKEFLFPTAEETVLFFSTVLMSMDTDCRRESVEALFEYALNGSLADVFWEGGGVVPKMLDGLVLASFADIYGQAFLDFYKIKQTPAWAKAVFQATKIGFRGINYLGERSPKLKTLLDRSGLLLWNDAIPAAEKRLKQNRKGIAEGTNLTEAR